MSPVARPPCAETLTRTTTWPTVTSPPNSEIPLTSTDALAVARPTAVEALVLAEIGPVDTLPAEKPPTYWTASGGALMVAVLPPGACTPQALALAVGAAVSPASAGDDAPAVARQPKAAAAMRNRFTATHYGDGSRTPSSRILIGR